MQNFFTRRILPLMMVLVLTFSFFPALAFAAETDKLLYVVMPDATHGFTGESIRHAEYELERLAAQTGLTYKLYKTADAKLQSDALDEAIREKAGAVVLWPITGESLRKAAERVKDAGIPLIVYDRLIEELEPDCEVLGDNMKIARLAGAYLNDYFAEEIASSMTIGILEFAGDDSTVPKQRTQGFVELAGENVTVAERFDTQWQRDAARSQMENWLETADAQEIESIQAVYAHDDEVVLGLMDAIAAYDGSAKLNIRLIIGMGGKRDLLMHMGYYKERFGIDLVTYQFSPAMIREAIDDGARVLRGEAIAAKNLIDTMEIDSGTLGTYLSSEAYKTRYTTAMPKLDTIPENAWYSFAISSRAIEHYMSIADGYGPNLPITEDYANLILASTLPYSAPNVSGSEILTRQRFAAMLMEALSAYELLEVNGSPNYADAGKVSDEYLAAVEYAYRTGLMRGVGGGLFEPEGILTRGQVAVALCNAVNACLSAAEAPEDADAYINRLYRMSVVDAITVEPEEIQSVLAVTPDSELVTWNGDGKILMVTWHDSPEQYPEDKAVTIEGYEVWTFTDKDIAAWYAQNSAGTTDWELRFKQLIGLPPDSAYTHFSFLWADPDDLLRPAYSQDIESPVMTDSFTESTEKWFIEWFEGNFEYSYSISAYPWTRLGYTYDWADNDSEYGLSEFIILPGSTVTVEETLTTDEFLEWLDAHLISQEAA